MHLSTLSVYEAMKSEENHVYVDTDTFTDTTDCNFNNFQLTALKGLLTLHLRTTSGNVNDDGFLTPSHLK